MKRGDTFDVPYEGHDITVTALPMRYDSFSAAHDAQRCLRDQGIPCVLDMAEGEVAVFAPVSFWERFAALAERRRTVPRRGASLRDLVKRAAGSDGGS